MDEFRYARANTTGRRREVEGANRPIVVGHRPAGLRVVPAYFHGVPGCTPVVAAEGPREITADANA